MQPYSLGMVGGESLESLIKENILWRCLKPAWFNTSLSGTVLRHSSTMHSETRSSPSCFRLRSCLPFLLARVILLHYSFLHFHTSSFPFMIRSVYITVISIYTAAVPPLRQFYHHYKFSFAGFNQFSITGLPNTTNHFLFYCLIFPFSQYFTPWLNE